MSQVAELFADDAEATSQSIATIVAHTPAIVLVDAGKRDDLYAHIRREVEAFKPDLTTVKGRDAIKSLAFKITRTKTAIDAAGKQLNEEARTKINVVDAARRDARETLDRLADQVRRPLTDWEEAEKAREAKIVADLASIADMANVTVFDTAATVAETIENLTALCLDPDIFRDAIDRAEGARSNALAALQSAHERLVREESDRAELAKLREEAAERERIEAEMAAAAEAERRQAEDARIAEERRAVAERAEAERMKRAEEAAAQAARDEELRKAREEQGRRDAEHQAALDAERAKAVEAERLCKAEADRIAAIEAEAKRVADEQAKREKNRAHRSSVMGEAKSAIISCGVEEPIAKAIVLAIVAGTVPHTSIQF